MTQMDQWDYKVGQCDKRTSGTSRWDSETSHTSGMH